MSLASLDAHDDITDARQGHAPGDVTDAKAPPPRGGDKQSVPTPASASMTIIPTTIIVYITFRTGRGDDPYDTFTKGPESYIQRKGFKKNTPPRDYRHISSVSKTGNNRLCEWLQTISKGGMTQISPLRVLNRRTSIPHRTQPSVYGEGVDGRLSRRVSAKGGKCEA